MLVVVGFPHQGPLEEPGIYMKRAIAYRKVVISTHVCSNLLRGVIVEEI